MTIKDWLEGLSYKLVQGSLDVEVNEVVYDSRKAAPGAVFVSRMVLIIWVVVVFPLVPVTPIMVSFRDG